jgi:adenylate cyclase
MGADEVGTLRALKAIRRELANPAIADHHGRVVKTTGDGILIEFPSAVAALRCAIEVQRAMAERNASEAEDRRISARHDRSQYERGGGQENRFPHRHQSGRYHH